MQSQDSQHCFSDEARLITEAMLDVIVQIDVQGVIQYASPSTWAVLGYTASQLIGCSFFDYIYAEDATTVQGSMKTVNRLVYRFRHAMGRHIWVETISTLLFGTDNTAVGVVFACRDVTEQRYNEQAIAPTKRLSHNTLLAWENATVP